MNVRRASPCRDRAPNRPPVRVRRPAHRLGAEAIASLAYRADAAATAR